MSNEEAQKTTVDVLATESGDVLVKHKKEKPNSLKTGPADNRFKIFFEDAEDLEEQVEKLEEQGFIVGEEEF